MKRAALQLWAVSAALVIPVAAANAQQIVGPALGPGLLIQTDIVQPDQPLAAAADLEQAEALFAQGPGRGGPPGGISGRDGDRRDGPPGRGAGPDRSPGDRGRGPSGPPRGQSDGRGPGRPSDRFGSRGRGPSGPPSRTRSSRGSSPRGSSSRGRGSSAGRSKHRGSSRGGFSQRIGRGSYRAPFPGFARGRSSWGPGRPGLRSPMSRRIEAMKKLRMRGGPLGNRFSFRGRSGRGPSGPPWMQNRSSGRGPGGPPWMRGRSDRGVVVRPVRRRRAAAATRVRLRHVVRPGLRRCAVEVTTVLRHRDARRRHPVGVLRRAVVMIDPAMTIDRAVTTAGVAKAVRPGLNSSSVVQCFCE